MKSRKSFVFVTLFTITLCLVYITVKLIETNFTKATLHNTRTNILSVMSTLHNELLCDDDIKNRTPVLDHIIVRLY